jgi:hypothetical protein
MNEVTVLSKVGEGAGRAIGTGLRATRRGSMQLSRSSAAAGLGAARMSIATARARAAKRAAQQLDAARAASKDVAVPTVAELRQELARRIEPKRRRRWPFVVAALVVGGGAAVVAARRPVAPPIAPAPPRVTDVEVAQ